MSFRSVLPILSQGPKYSLIPSYGLRLAGTLVVTVAEYYHRSDNKILQKGVKIAIFFTVDNT